MPSAIKYLDRCIFVPTLGGTADWVVAGNLFGYNTPANAGATNTSTYYYTAQSPDLSQWEYGIATYTVAGTIVARTTVLLNSLGTQAKIAFTNPPWVQLGSILAEGYVFDQLQPMTTLGDVIYGGASGAGTRLAGNTTTTNKFLTQVGNGTISAAPAWNTIQPSDLPGAFSGFANPSASIGLTAVNGAATTAMRSDAAPALSQAIAPTWTGLHTFTRGQSGAVVTPLPAISLGSYFLSPTSAVSPVTHLDIFGGQYGFGIQGGQLMLGSGGTFAFYPGAALANSTPTLLIGTGGAATFSGNITSTAGNITASAGSIIATAGQVLTAGASAAFSFSDRTTSLQWIWYASGGAARLWNATNPDRWTCDVAGNVAMNLLPGAAGSFTYQSANTGFGVGVNAINGGTITNPGTTAQMVVQLTGAAASYIQTIVIGNATTPFAQINAGTGMTGGLSVAAGAGNLLLQSTAANAVMNAQGTSFANILQVGGSNRFVTANTVCYFPSTSVNVGIGTTTPNAQLTITDNATAFPGTLPATPVHFLINAANSEFARFNMFTYAAPGAFVGCRAEGTAAAPTAVAANSLLFLVTASGWNGTTWDTHGHGSYRITAQQNWTTANQGTYAGIWATPLNSVTDTENTRFWGHGGVSFNGQVANDPGANNLLTGGNITAISGTIFLPQLTAWNQVVDANAGSFILYKSRGASGAGSVVLVNDALGSFAWRGNDSTGTVQNAAFITGLVTAVGSGFVTAKLSFTGSSFAFGGPIQQVFNAPAASTIFSSQAFGTGVNFLEITNENLNLAGQAVYDSVVYHTFGGSTVQGARCGSLAFIAITAATSPSNTLRDYTGGAWGAEINSCGDNGTNLIPFGGGAGAAGTLFGGNIYSQIFGSIGSPSNNWLEICGLEIDMFGTANVSMCYNLGLTLVSINATQGTVLDAAIVLYSGAQAFWGPGVGFKNGLVFAELDGNGLVPISASGTLISGHVGTLSSIPVTNGVDLRLFTFSGNAYQSPGFQIDPTGGGWFSKNGNSTYTYFTPNTGGNPVHASGLAIGWNHSAGGGEVNLIANINGGAPNPWDFIFSDWNGTTVTNTVYFANRGGIYSPTTVMQGAVGGCTFAQGSGVVGSIGGSVSTNAASGNADTRFAVGFGSADSTNYPVPYSTAGVLLGNSECTTLFLGNTSAGNGDPTPQGCTLAGMFSRGKASFTNSGVYGQSGALWLNCYGGWNGSALTFAIATVTLSTGSATITVSAAPTSHAYVQGMPVAVTGGTGTLVVGCVIARVNSPTSLTLSSAPTGNGTATLTFTAGGASPTLATPTFVAQGYQPFSGTPGDTFMINADIRLYDNGFGIAEMFEGTLAAYAVSGAANVHAVFVQVGITGGLLAVSTGTTHTIGVAMGMTGNSGIEGIAYYAKPGASDWGLFAAASGFKMTTTGTISAPSDPTLKADITALPSMWNQFKRIDPVSFRWRDEHASFADPAHRGKKRWGFLSRTHNGLGGVTEALDGGHEHSALSTMHHTLRHGGSHRRQYHTGDTFDVMDHDHLWVMNFRVTRELQDRVETAEQKIARLEGRITELEARLEAPALVH